jgi:reversibly glycosylated polypeptide/UDP-arabinopyranose mutase
MTDVPRIRTGESAEIEVVVPTIRSLENLEAWRKLLEGVHVIVVQDGDPDTPIEVPQGLNVTVYTRRDVERLLGERSWVISRRDSGCRCFGFLVATAPYVYTLDDDCLPPAASDPIQLHLANLRSPAHPDYFNTLFDLEFVRGYPHALRSGHRTAISHGLWFEHPDLDAITQSENPDLRVIAEVPIVQTVPRGVPYSMCGMNLAFDRQLVGPSLYFGLMGEGQPWGRYDDLWAGWCSKVICDHLGYGVKTGRPYVVHRKASDWRANLEREEAGMRWATRLFEFFRDVTFEPGLDDVGDCYLYLAGQVERALVELDPYFGRLAEAMRVWVELWRELAHVSSESDRES